MKLCRTCNTEKNEGDFGKRSASVDGLAAKCKSCQSEYDKKRAMLPRRIKAREEYAKTDKGIAAGNKAKKAWEARNAIKRGAATIVGNAIRDGKLEKQYFCSVCSIDDVIIHGHHDDYAKPLEVRWLCPACHVQWHRDNGEGKNSN
jgi:hypothetical protein